MAVSAVLDISNCIIERDLHGGNWYLEPTRVVDRIPTALLDGDLPLVIIIKNKEKEIEMTMPGFLSKPYPVNKGVVRLANMRFELADLTITVGIRFQLEDLSGLIDTEMD
jgi:hypothetical protein